MLYQSCEKCFQNDLKFLKSDFNFLKILGEGPLSHHKSLRQSDKMNQKGSSALPAGVAAGQADPTGQLAATSFQPVKITTLA